MRRFLSSFSFHVGLFSTSEVMEVNFVDLIALEAIRTFEPDLYHSLAQNREIVFRVGGYRPSRRCNARRSAPSHYHRRDAASQLARRRCENGELVNRRLGQDVPGRWLRLIGR